MPWDRAVDVIAEVQTEQQERFQIQKGFGVQRVLNDEELGSIIAMTFNEFGHLIVSRENGPLLLISDKDQDGIPEHVTEYCDLVKNCHGILAKIPWQFFTRSQYSVTCSGIPSWSLSEISSNGPFSRETIR